MTRIRYIDWARALAIIVMIEAHTVDAWTRSADRATIGFRNARIVGGFAAPLFLWLAGVALMLAATNIARRSGRWAAVDAVCRRGLEIFILAFAFRLQAFVLSPGSHPLTLFRVDILNVMGPAIVLAALVWGLSRTTGGRVFMYASITAAIGLVTPVVRATHAIDQWPALVQWYIRPAGEQTTFTSLPWAGFVFAGAAVGTLLAARDSWRLHAALAGVGAALVAIGLYTASLPAIYHQSSFWTSSPTYFAIRVGIVMLALTAIYALDRVSDPEILPSIQTALTRFGRSSLFVYWIHVELVYGYASWLWRGALPLWGSLVACAAFTILMYGAIIVRDRIAEAWRARRAAQPSLSA